MNILLAIDDSDCSRAAIDHVLQRVLPASVEIHVLNVLQWAILTQPAFAYGHGQEYGHQIKLLAEKERDQAAGLVRSVCHVLQAAGFRTSAIVREGDPERQILDYAAEWPPDLIVMGTHGRTGLDRLLLGSVSQAVAQHTSYPIHICRS